MHSKYFHKVQLPALALCKDKQSTLKQRHPSSYLVALNLGCAKIYVHAVSMLESHRSKSCMVKSIIDSALSKGKIMQTEKKIKLT